MVVAVDAAGGDYFPKNPIAGAILALNEDPSLQVLLVGPKDQVIAELETQEYDQNRIEVVDAPQIIGMHDSPAAAVKSKRNSSIAVGIALHRAGKCHAFVSAGNTGAT